MGKKSTKGTETGTVTSEVSNGNPLPETPVAENVPSNPDVTTTPGSEPLVVDDEFVPRGGETFYVRVRDAFWSPDEANFARTLISDEDKKGHPILVGDMAANKYKSDVKALGCVPLSWLSGKTFTYMVNGEKQTIRISDGTSYVMGILNRRYALLQTANNGKQLEAFKATYVNPETGELYVPKWFVLDGNRRYYAIIPSMALRLEKGLDIDYKIPLSKLPDNLTAVECGVHQWTHNKEDSVGKVESSLMNTLLFLERLRNYGTPIKQVHAMICNNSGINSNTEQGRKDSARLLRGLYSCDKVLQIDGLFPTLEVLKRIQLPKKHTDYIDLAKIDYTGTINGQTAPSTVLTELLKLANDDEFRKADDAWLETLQHLPPESKAAFAAKKPVKTDATKMDWFLRIYINNGNPEVKGNSRAMSKTDMVAAGNNTSSPLLKRMLHGVAENDHAGTVQDIDFKLPLLDAVYLANITPDVADLLRQVVVWSTRPEATDKFNQLIELIK